MKPTLKKDLKVPNGSKTKNEKPSPKVENKPKAPAQKKKKSEPQVRIPNVKAKTSLPTGVRLPPPKGKPVTKSHGTSKQHAMTQQMPESHTEYSIQNRLKQKSPWFESIKSPKQGAGCKIPDVIGTDTGTLQMVLPVTVQANAQGMAGVKVRTPYPNKVETTDFGYNYNITQSTASPSSVVWGDGNASPGGDNAGKPFPSNEFMYTNTQGVRIVSSSITAVHEISSNNDTGEMCGWSIPFDFTANTGHTYSQYTEYYNSSTLPLNQKKAMCARWYPTSATKARTQPEGIDDVVTVSYVDFVSPQIDVGETLIDWEYGIVCNGLPVNGVVKFEITVNYEFIPLYSALDIITPEASPSDVIEENLVKSWMPDLPKTIVVPTSKLAAPAGDSTRPDNFGMGMMFDVIKEALPLLMTL